MLLCNCTGLANLWQAHYNSPMKLIRTWDISSDAFYDYLETKIAEEILQNTGRTVKAQDFSGFRYRRKGADGGADTVIVIDDYQRGKIYQVTARSLQETMTNTFGLISDLVIFLSTVPE